MNATKITTECQLFRKARSVNQTSTSFVSKVPTNTEPTGDAGTATGSSIIELGDGTAQNAVMIVPYSVGNANTTFSMRIIGWRVVGTSPTNWVWVPVNLAEILCTAGTTTGVANCVVLSTELFTDTITLVGTSGNLNISIELVSPADNTIAHALADMKGCQKLEISFSTGSSATSCNALLALL